MDDLGVELLRCRQPLCRPPSGIMPRRRKDIRRVVKAVHLKFAAITNTTIVTYKSAVCDFLAWRRRLDLPWPKSEEDFDILLSEYVNFLYREDEPLYKAGDVLCGIQRFLPRVKRSLHLTRLYYKNSI